MNVFSNSYPFERNMIVVTVFHLIMKHTEVRLAHNQKKYCHHGHISFTLKGIRKIFISVYYKLFTVYKLKKYFKNNLRCNIKIFISEKYLRSNIKMLLRYVYIKTF